MTLCPFSSSESDQPFTNEAAAAPQLFQIPELSRIQPKFVAGPKLNEVRCPEAAPDGAELMKAAKWQHHFPTWRQHLESTMTEPEIWSSIKIFGNISELICRSQLNLFNFVIAFTSGRLNYS